MKLKPIYTFLILCAMAYASACRKDYTDPSSVNESQAYSSAIGLTGTLLGAQETYSSNQTSAIYNKVAINGLSTFELILLNQGNVGEFQLSTGGNNVDATNSDLNTLWQTDNKVIYVTSKIIAATPDVVNDPAYASGLVAYATILKALAMGDLSEFWNQVPSGTGTAVTFIDRLQGYKNAIAQINSALALIQANPVSQKFTLSLPFTASASPQGIDIEGTLNALKARYSLFIGDYATALSAANAVDLSKASTFNYAPVNPNPIYITVTATNNIFQPVDSTLGLPAGLAPNAADQRVPFYTSINSKMAPRFRINGFGNSVTNPYPLYLPGEMSLIKAEAYIRQASPDLASALAQLNVVVTKKASSDPLGVGANLPPIAGPLTAAQLLDQIYRNRCIELFMSGLKLEDARRFGRPLTEIKRNFFPYPFSERDNNRNTPADPAF